MEELWARICAFFSGSLPEIIGAIVVLAVGFPLAGKAAKWTRRALSRSHVEPTVHGFLSSVVKVMGQILVLLTAAGVLGIPITSFLALLGGAAVAISLALQNSLSNVASGLLLLFNRPCKVGDYIEVDGVSGVVQSIQIMNTTLLTYDHRKVVLPNATITGKTLINYSSEAFRRVDFTVSISYQSDIEHATALLKHLAQTHPFASVEPPARIFVSALSDSSVDFTVQIWCTNEHYWDLSNDFYARVKQAFDAGGIEIPYSQLVVHTKEEA